VGINHDDFPLHVCSVRRRRLRDELPKVFLTYLGLIMVDMRYQERRVVSSWSFGLILKGAQCTLFRTCNVATDRVRPQPHLFSDSRKRCSIWFIVIVGILHRHTLSMMRFTFYDALPFTDLSSITNI
jgi:hypothetical protein